MNFFLVFFGVKEGLNRIEVRNNVWETKQTKIVLGFVCLFVVLE